VKIIRENMKASSIVLATLLTASVNLNAATIYDEAIDGDAGLWWYSTTSAQLGLVTSGDMAKGYTQYAKGVLTQWDGYEFTLDGSLNKIMFEIIGSRANTWQLYDASNTILLSSDHSSSLFDFNIAGLIGTYKLGNNHYTVNENDSGYNYTITFGEVSEVPVPAAAFLFAPALLGFMGLRRKAKNSVA
jgi:hypothetical protein